MTKCSSLSKVKPVRKSTLFRTVIFCLKMAIFNVRKTLKLIYERSLFLTHFHERIIVE